VLSLCSQFYSLNHSCCIIRVPCWNNAYSKIYCYESYWLSNYL